MSKRVYLIEDVKTHEVYTAEEWAEMNEVAGVIRKLNAAYKDSDKKTIRVKSDDPVLSTKLSTPWLKPPRTLCLYVMPDFTIIAAREDHAPEGYRLKILASKRTYETAGTPGAKPVPGWFGREREPKKKVPTSDVLLGE